jgi:hypothetical protein
MKAVVCFMAVSAVVANAPALLAQPMAPTQPDGIPLEAMRRLQKLSAPLKPPTGGTIPLGYIEFEFFYGLKLCSANCQGPSLTYGDQFLLEAYYPYGAYKNLTLWVYVLGDCNAENSSGNLTEVQNVALHRTSGVLNKTYDSKENPVVCVWTTALPPSGYTNLRCPRCVRPLSVRYLHSNCGSRPSNRADDYWQRLHKQYLLPSRPPNSLTH